VWGAAVGARVRARGRPGGGSLWSDFFFGASMWSVEAMGASAAASAGPTVASGEAAPTAGSPSSTMGV
jgi:hypothetical protein